MIQRLCRHLFSPSVRRAFPPATLQAITEAIAAGEQRHGGQVMFAVEADLPLHALWHKITRGRRPNMPSPACAPGYRA